MEILAQATSSDLPGAVKLSSIVLGILAIYIAIKIAKVFFKLVFGVIGLVLLGAAAWWFLLNH
jgi:hypothetical protein